MFCLDIVSSGGNVAIQGVIGGDGTLASLDINEGGGAGTIEVASIGDSDTYGVTSGATRIGNTSTATLTLDGTVYKFDGAATFTTTSGENIDITDVAVFFRELRIQHNVCTSDT